MELPEDLEVVCKDCHPQADIERANATRIRAYDMRVDGWATKKYGEDWWENHDSEEVEEKFDEWLDSKSDGW